MKYMYDFMDLLLEVHTKIETRHSLPEGTAKQQSVAKLMDGLN